MRNYPVEVLNALGDASRTGDAFFVGQTMAASFVGTYADGSAAGTLKVQGSNQAAPAGTDPLRYQPPATSFADITNATSAVASGAGPAIVLATMNFIYVRVVFTRSGGGASPVIVRMAGLGV
jgi:hypothetical protein